MDAHRNPDQHDHEPPRKDPSPINGIKENILPVAIAAVALVLILIFIIGSITRGVQRKRYNAEQEKQAAAMAQQIQETLDKEAESISTRASDMADRFDYHGAIALIESFSGELEDYPQLQNKLSTYNDALQHLVLWDDPASVINLSVHVLIEDGSRAFTDATYGASYNRNFITTTEFRNILQQLYENQYILVSLADVANEDGMSIYLPDGKKPFILTQTNVNYYNYMIDSDQDTFPDAGGDGFASKLIIDPNGNISCQMTDAQGETVTGAYDLVPILESFIETHPDFSYCNAKAVLAVSGYDGIFGYRTYPTAAEYLGPGGYELELTEASQVCEKLRSLGYELACYTYDNAAYGVITAEQITEDLTAWENEVLPIMGHTDILVYAQSSDIDSAGIAYTGPKFDTLLAYGFTRFLGFSSANEPWFYSDESYARQGRIMITGSNLAHHAPWFEGMFDAATILDPTRGDVPA